MYEESSRYPKNRVETFFKYLVNAAGKIDKLEKRKSISQQTAGNLISEEKETYQEERDPVELPAKKSHFIEERLGQINDDRKEHLEIKINMYFTNNKYLPFEIRIKKIRHALIQLGRTNHFSKIQMKSLRSRINKCEELLKNIKKYDYKKYHTD